MTLADRSVVPAAGSHPHGGAGAAADRRPRAATAALARVEAVRLLRHPAVLVATALYLALWLNEWISGDISTRYPVLQDEDRYVQVPVLLIAAGALLASNLAVLRPHRHGLEPFYDVQLLSPWRRTVAHLLAALPLVALSAVLVALRFLYLATAPGAVGRASVVELATAPVIVLLGAAVGVAAGRLTRAVAAAPLLVLGIAVFTIVGAVTHGRPGLRWWAPVAIEDEFQPPLPVDLMNRPAGWHLVYLAALVVVACAAALLVSGASRYPLTALLVLALVAAAGTGQAQPVAVSDDLAARRSSAELAPADQQVCRVRGEVTYCAFADFEDRIAQWQAVADGILRWVPPEAGNGPYFVRQRLHFVGESSGGPAPELPQRDWDRDDERAGTPGSVPVGTDWGADQIGSDTVLQFAGHFAARVVAGAVPRDVPDRTVCQSRAVLVLWLAGQASPDTEHALRSLTSRSSGGIVLPVLGSSVAVSIGWVEVEVALDLLARPVNETGARIRAAWSELTATDTTTAEAAKLLGVTLPDTSDDGSRLC